MQGFLRNTAPAMNNSEQSLPERIRAEVTKATSEGARLSLRQISTLCDVNYGRLWRFMRRKNPSDILMLDEAQRIHTTLTNSPLLTNCDVE